MTAINLCFKLIIISFPPLHGHEIIVILCGLIYGLGFGFGVAAIGTLLGEIANYLSVTNSKVLG